MPLKLLEQRDREDALRQSKGATDSIDALVYRRRLGLDVRSQVGSSLTEDTDSNRAVEAQEYFEKHRLLNTRGAADDLTVAKHQLRDWIESRLASLPEDGDVRGFQLALNNALDDAELFCIDVATECGDNNLG